MTGQTDATPLHRALKTWTGKGLEDLHKVAFRAGQLVGAGETTCPHAEAALRRAAEVRGYKLPEVHRVIVAGLEAGIAIPRPWAELKAANDNSAISATPYVWRETSDVPLRQFVYGKHLVRGFITTDVAPGGVGKSTQVVTDALAMVTGRMLLGDEPRRKLRCWLWNGEDPREEIERRIAAACAFHKVGKDDIAGRLFVDSGRDSEIVLVSEDRNKIVYAAPVVDAVKATIKANEIDVLIVDPFVTTHAVPENDNTKIAAVAKQWAQIADETNCAVQIVHHVRKSDGGELTAEDARGAGALVNAARFVRVLNPMSPAEETAAGLKRGERFRFFRVSNGKSNLTPRSEHSEWREMVSQPMGNGTALGQPQDHVGVVRRWSWPSDDSLVAELPNGALEAIKNRLRGGDYREHELSANWAGLVVADVLKIELCDKDSRRPIKRMLAAWIKAGVLRTEAKRDPVKRETKNYIVPVEE